MSAYVQVSLQWWVAEEEAIVRAHYSDLRHHMIHEVHPNLRFEVLTEGYAGSRFVLRRKGWFATYTSVMSREVEPDGTVLDTVIHGTDRGATLACRFTSSSVDSHVGTMVEQVWRQPLPWWAGVLGAAWLRARLMRRFRRWAEDKKFDLEVRGYMPVPLREAA